MIETSKLPSPVRATIANTLIVLHRTTHEHVDCIARGEPCGDARAIMLACEVSIATFLACCESMGVDGEAVISELRAGAVS